VHRRVTSRPRFLANPPEKAANPRGTAFAESVRVNLTRALGSWAAAALLATAWACSSSGGETTPGDGRGTPSTDAGASTDAMTDGGDGDDAGPLPFQEDPPAVYVAKVKNILVGLPPTDAELKAVEAAPSALAGLVDAWMALPQYQEKMLTFFSLAFQQTQISLADIATYQTAPRSADLNPATAPLLLQNIRESFARTVLALVAEGRPFTEAVTTKRFVVTPAMLEFYGFLDAYQLDDARKLTDGFAAQYPKVSITLSAASGPIPPAESVDPSNPNFMHWYNPAVATPPTGEVGTDCQVDPMVLPGSAAALHAALEGSILNRKSGSGMACVPRNGDATTSLLTPSDYTTWKMVTFRAPKAGESPTPFWDLDKLRAATELVLTVPRVGFFSTPAFFANWATNSSNEMRVTINQTLIVALGNAIDGTDSTMPSSTPGLDQEHAGSADCVTCHRLLDPTRSILSATYSWDYHRQTDAALKAQPGLFAFQGVVKPVATIDDFAQALATHPLFASAWVQKLCYWVNSRACKLDDPEVGRIVQLFASKHHDWNALVRELVTSPITTNAAPTKTATDLGEVVAVARRDHLCAALDARLGLTDVCGLDATVKKTTSIPQIVSGLPSDGYGRGGVAPVLPNDPTLFFRAGTENICAQIAGQVIDNAKPAAGVKQWSSKAPDAAVADFVALVMGLPASDPRAAQATTILSGHYQAALGQGENASNALKSTFVTACLAPSTVTIGL
jgi:hypothetical protein